VARNFLTQYRRQRIIPAVSLGLQLDFADC